MAQVPAAPPRGGRRGLRRRAGRPGRLTTSSCPARACLTSTWRWVGAPGLQPPHSCPHQPCNGTQRGKVGERAAVRGGLDGPSAAWGRQQVQGQHDSPAEYGCPGRRPGGGSPRKVLRTTLCPGHCSALLAHGGVWHRCGSHSWGTGGARCHAELPGIQSERGDSMEEGVRMLFPDNGLVCCCPPAVRPGAFTGHPGAQAQRAPGWG